MILELPYPPTVNTMYATVNGRRVKSAKARAYQATIMGILSISKVPDFKSHKLSVTVWVYPPDRRKRDLSNLDKALMDSLVAGGLFDDDSQIDELRFVRKEQDPEKKGYVRVQINTFDDHKKWGDA